jgi:hypothetical protein
MNLDIIKKPFWKLYQKGLSRLNLLYFWKSMGACANKRDILHHLKLRVIIHFDIIFYFKKFQYLYYPKKKPPKIIGRLCYIYCIDIILSNRLPNGFLRHDLNRFTNIKIHLNWYLFGLTNMQHIFGLTKPEPLF